MSATTMFRHLSSLWRPSGRPRSRWPSRLLLVRHGESAGNVARDAAQAAGLTRIDIADRDADVPLSSRGIERLCRMAVVKGVLAVNAAVAETLGVVL